MNDQPATSAAEAVPDPVIRLDGVDLRPGASAAAVACRELGRRPGLG